VQQTPQEQTSKPVEVSVKPVPPPPATGPSNASKPVPPPPATGPSNASKPVPPPPVVTSATTALKPVKSSSVVNKPVEKPAPVSTGFNQNELEAKIQARAQKMAKQEKMEVEIR